jgi:Protein of unknown function (DUF554)
MQSSGNFDRLSPPDFAGTSLLPDHLSFWDARGRANSFAVLSGGLIGAVVGKRVPAHLRHSLTQVFGLCLTGLEAALVVQVKHLAVMVLSLILGSLIGELIRLESGSRL